jgi:cytochrome c biogenesis protein
MIGLFITFFSSHRRVWIKIREDGEGSKITIAGMANKNPIGMERYLDHLADQINIK